MSNCCSSNVRIVQIPGAGEVDFTTLTPTEVTELTQAIDFCQLTTAQIQCLIPLLDLSLLTPAQVQDLCAAMGVLFTVNAGDTAAAGDNAGGEGSVECGSVVHFWSSDGSVNVAVTDGSAIVDLTVDTAALNIPTAITGIDLQPTGNPNEFTVGVTWTDPDGNTQTTTDPTPITITGPDTFGTVATAAAALTTTNGVAVAAGEQYVDLPDGTTYAAPPADPVPQEIDWFDIGGNPTTYDPDSAADNPNNAEILTLANSGVVAETIQNVNGGTYTLQPNETVQISLVDGAWYTTGGTAGSPDTFGTVSTAAAALTTTNGVAVPAGGQYVEFPDGTTWASVSAAGGDTVTGLTYDGTTLTVTTDQASFDVPFDDNDMTTSAGITINGTVVPPGTPISTILSDLATVAHVPVTVTDSTTVDLTLTGQDVQADVIISPDALNIVEDLNGVYAPSHVSREYCGGGAVDNLAEALSPTTIALGFNIVYQPTVTHTTAEIEVILRKDGTVAPNPPYDLGRLQVFDDTNGGVLHAQSDNAITYVTNGVDQPAIYTFTGLSFTAGVDYRLEWEFGASNFGARRVDEFNACWPVRVLTGTTIVESTPAIRIDNGTYSQTTLVTEYFNPDGTFKNYVVKDECTGTVTETLTLDPGLEECGYVREVPEVPFVRGRLGFSGAFTMAAANTTDPINTGTAASAPVGVNVTAGGIEILEAGRYRFDAFFRVAAGSSADASWGIGVVGGPTEMIQVDTDFGQPFSFATDAVFELSAGDIVYPMTQTSIIATYNFRAGSHMTVTRIN